MKIELDEQGYFWPETTVWRQLAWRCTGLDEGDLLQVLLALLQSRN